MSLALSSRELAQALPDAAALLLGVAYVFGSLRCAVELRAFNPYWFFFGLSLNWAGDIAAFYVGRLIGRHKLAPEREPGEIVGRFHRLHGGDRSSMAPLLSFAWLRRSAPLAEALGLTVIANIAGQLGDLCESALKNLFKHACWSRRSACR